MQAVFAEKQEIESMQAMLKKELLVARLVTYKQYKNAALALESRFASQQGSCALSR